MHLLGKAETGYPTTAVDEGARGGGGVASGAKGGKGKPADEGATESERGGASGGERQEEYFEQEEGAGQAWPLYMLSLGGRQTAD